MSSKTALGDAGILVFIAGGFEVGLSAAIAIKNRHWVLEVIWACGMAIFYSDFRYYPSRASER